jgi:hypothetical protein
MVSDHHSPPKHKLRLPQSSSGVGYLPPAMPRQREPNLWPYKLPLVVLTLTSLATVALSPWPRYQGALWMLVFFSSCSLMSVLCQALRMISTVRTYHSLYCGSGAGSSTPGSIALSGGGPGSALGGGSSSHACSIASSPSSASLSGKDTSCATKVVVLEPSRPGHKKALRKGHRSNNVSLDATGDCCSDQLESVALVINCEDWSDTSGSGTDWAAGPPRWNHVFVIPNFKEVRVCE